MIRFEELSFVTSFLDDFDFFRNRKLLLLILRRGVFGIEVVLLLLLFVVVLYSCPNILVHKWIVILYK